MRASIGSFLNLVADRLSEGRSLVRPRSACPSCERPLPGREMVPVLSHLWLRGRCRRCSAGIPVRLFVVEVLTGVLFTAAYLRYGAGVELLVVCAAVALFLAVAIIDLEHRLILNHMVFPSMAVLLLAAPFWTEMGFPRTFLGDSTMMASFLNSLASDAGAFLLFYLVLVAYPSGFGAGDVNLAGMMGLLLGFPTIAAALWIGIVVAGALATTLVVTRRQGRKDAMAFGQFMSAGGILVLLVDGDTITDWYLDAVSGLAGV